MVDNYFPLVQYDLIPVYVDVCPLTFNLNTQDVKKCLEEYDIKAIMLIHTYGNPADMEFYKNLCESNSLILVEDTCESMGASWDNKPVGSFGDLGTFSSYFLIIFVPWKAGLLSAKIKIYLI